MKRIVFCLAFIVCIQALQAQNRMIIKNETDYSISLLLVARATLPPYDTGCGHMASIKLTVPPQSKKTIEGFNKPEFYGSLMWNSTDFGQVTGNSLQNLYGQADWVNARIYKSSPPSNCCGGLWDDPACTSPPSGTSFDNGSYSGKLFYSDGDMHITYQ